jgi:hypothetical protein
MYCVICGNVIALHKEATVPIRSGELVHLMCAERAAQSAWRRRQCWARLHGFTGMGMTVGVWLSDVDMWWWIALAVAAAHMVVHRRWWYFVTKDLCRWLSVKRH